jgi:integrase
MTMTDSQRVDAFKALAVLAPYGAILTQAAEAFAERAALLSRTVTFAERREELLLAKKADKASTRYFAYLKTRLTRAGESFDEMPVATIKPRELDDWLRQLPLPPMSRVNYRKVLRTAFEFAVNRRYARENPVAKTSEVKATPTAPEILSPVELNALLRAAPAEILPWLAIAVRDAEVGRLTWNRVDLENGYIRIDAAIAKTSSRRLVPIVDNLRAWLLLQAKKTGPVRPLPQASYPLFRDARRSAHTILTATGTAAPNLADWPHNALRHSFASYRTAEISNASQVAEECGHSVQIMKQHYRELVTKKEAEAWFGVMPSKSADVVPFVQEFVG